MTGEDIIDCIMEVDKILEELESDIENKNLKKASQKLKEARAIIEDLREEDEADDDREEIEMKIMEELK
ncbi:TPA: hypothetical protein HA235_07540 [Candidatus Woesearchaeota archaeon]|nr:hypothetical protein [Candidatus Woesearchaeota archaeon]HIH32531.1 hypothetical protein [Candidatus Woesearchaeota archaeon]HIH55093.1 hypothetical protein [Candidatus Woesearchaeota archaeon]HIJ01714.1 hypothetical protein [Candidatus Woesearchaeota archaeon]HIJ13246.1 hypothetical protein [Candidatus Woesearchaeota archaeon]